jgi:hypothetical protein
MVCGGRRFFSNFKNEATGEPGRTVRWRIRGSFVFGGDKFLLIFEGGPGGAGKRLASRIDYRFGERSE